MALPPLPIVSQTPIANPTGTPSQPWYAWLNAVDALLRATAAGVSMRPLAEYNEIIIDPVSGFSPDAYAKYWKAFDLALRSSGWPGKNGAPKTLAGQPPALGWSMVYVATKILVLPWAVYFMSVDAVARPQA